MVSIQIKERVEIKIIKNYYNYRLQRPRSTATQTVRSNFPKKLSKLFTSFAGRANRKARRLTQ